jgi:hypothetical protein
VGLAVALASEWSCSSNPSLSSAESTANFVFGREAWKGPRRRQGTIPTLDLPETAETTVGRSSSVRLRQQGLSRYAEAALDLACRAILAAPDGQQEVTLNKEAFSVGTLTASGALPPEFAERVLLWCAFQIPDYDPVRPWRKEEIERKVRRAFGDGMARPRGGRDVG